MLLYGTAALNVNTDIYRPTVVLDTPNLACYHYLFTAGVSTQGCVICVEGTLGLQSGTPLAQLGQISLGNQLMIATFLTSTSTS